jgi:hypothetical protein
MNEALIKGDSATFIEYQLPNIVTLLGGKVKAIETIEKKFRSIKDKGTILFKVNTSDSSQIIQVDNEIQCVSFPSFSASTN